MLVYLSRTNYIIDIQRELRILMKPSSELHLTITQDFKIIKINSSKH